ncbi:hypothetical protein AAH991_09905 [Microbispora sp. ZYX-F-249]|uniref:Uncharacterized protein n=1 Tax=Microbispora maris TaxID=3144104 RepID=A0ABV0ANF3_9ACTN
MLQLPIAALFLVRLLAPARRSERMRLRDGDKRPGPLSAAARLSGRIAVAATIVVLLAVTVTGRDGGRTPGVKGAPLNVTQVQVWVGLALLVVVIAAVAYRLRPVRQAPSSVTGDGAGATTPLSHQGRAAAHVDHADR